MPTSVPPFILASNSPRRAALLADAGYSFVVIAPDPTRESGPLPHESAEQHVARLAHEKAALVANELSGRAKPDLAGRKDVCETRNIIIAADTVAECAGEILGKPLDRNHARQMLRQLRGKTHRVLTGLCLWRYPQGHSRTEIDVTNLKMSPLSDAEIDAYLDSDRWRGKAGGFGFQDGNDWVRIVSGSPSNVVGLPMELLSNMLREFAAP
jgi:septum formation protein